MRPFRFRLENVLRLRQHETLVAKQALGDAEQLAEMAREALESTRAARLAHASSVEAQRQAGMTVQQWRAAGTEQERLSDLEQRAAEAYHQALIHVHQKRRELDEARRREKPLEKLREHHEEQHRLAELAAEQLVLDEISQQMYRRQRKGAIV